MSRGRPRKNGRFKTAFALNDFYLPFLLLAMVTSSVLRIHSSRCGVYCGDEVLNKSPGASFEAAAEDLDAVYDADLDDGDRAVAGLDSCTERSLANRAQGMKICFRFVQQAR